MQPDYNPVLASASAPMEPEQYNQPAISTQRQIQTIARPARRPNQDRDDISNDAERCEPARQTRTRNGASEIEAAPADNLHTAQAHLLEFRIRRKEALKDGQRSVGNQRTNVNLVCRTRHRLAETANPAPPKTFGTRSMRVAARSRLRPRVWFFSVTRPTL